ncbi:glycosyltransferase family 4 protein [Paenibacillus sp. NPDC058174]|uniref:glycosyltransferase family 4 protein n=1 Tax=Paenibacillus sp. NPDC058174 TaxID=3346366 RepID=UPI0036DAF949
MENMETVPEFKLNRLRVAVIALEFISPRHRTGGVSHYNHRLCMKLAEMGCDVTAITMNAYSGELGYKLLPLFEDKEVTNRFVRYYMAPIKGRTIDFADYDLVISSGDDWAMRRSEKTWIRIMHGSAYREVQHNKKWLRKLNLSLLYVLELLSLRQSTVTLFNSKDTQTLYRSRLQDKVLHLPVDHQLFHPGEKAEDPAILFVGALDSRKRGRLLRDLFISEIKPKIPNAKLWMVCYPDEPHEGVTYYQSLSTEQLAELYRKAHIYCMPSTYEGFGLPYLEALASGTLVVSTPNPGAVEILGEGQYGVLASDEGLASALIDGLLSGDSFKDKVADGLEWARSHSWEAVASEYLSYCPQWKGAGAMETAGATQ